MKPDLTKVLITKIKEQIPSHIKLVDYLMNSLSLSRESAYRRIRNQVPFTFDEVVKLAYENDFSIDELVKKERNEYSLELFDNTYEHLQEMFIDMMHIYDEIGERMCNAKLTGSINAVGHMNMGFVLDTDYLFRFMYYKWMHQFYGIPLTIPFSEFYISPEIIALKNKCIHTARSTSSSVITIIVDQFTFLALIRSINYYYEIKLMTKEELFLIAEEFHSVINNLHEMTKKRCDEAGNKCFFYLSTLSMESNSRFIRFDDDWAALISLNNIYDLRIKNPEECRLIEVWLNSLKRDSTLITESSEWLQVKYFNRQHEYLDNIDNQDFLIFFKK